MNVKRIVLTAVFTCSARVLSLRIPADARKKKKKTLNIFVLSSNQRGWGKYSQVGLFYVVEPFLKAQQTV